MTDKHTKPKSKLAKTQGSFKKKGSSLNDLAGEFVAADSNNFTTDTKTKVKLGSPKDVSLFERDAKKIRDLLSDLNNISLSIHGQTAQHQTDWFYNGISPCVAGGFIRDHVAGITPKDVDVWMPRPPGRQSVIAIIRKLDELGWDVDTTMKSVDSRLAPPDHWPWPSAPWRNILPSADKGTLNAVSENPYDVSSAGFIKEIVKFNLAGQDYDLIFIDPEIVPGSTSVTKFFDMPCCCFTARMVGGIFQVRGYQTAIDDIHRRRLRHVNPSVLNDQQKTRFHARAERLRDRFKQQGQNWSIEYVD